MTHPSSPPAPMTAGRLDQCAWLIECRIGPESTYIQLKSREELSQEWEEEIHARGYDAAKKLKPWHFTKDASSATRFAREEDAARAMVALGMQGPTGLLDWLRPTEHMWSDAAHPDVSNVPALTARVAELERERQYTCEQHRNEVRKGERCVWCELAAARGAFDLSESERQRLAGRINATEARKVEDGDVQDAVDWLRDRAECSSITLDPAPMGPIADLLTRLSAALKEAGQRASDHLRASEILNRHCVRLEARAQAAEATIDAAQGHFEFLIAMTQLADVNGKVEVRSTGQTKFASEPLATAMAREAFAALVEIRALQTKDTTP